MANILAIDGIVGRIGDLKFFGDKKFAKMSFSLKHTKRLFDGRQVSQYFDVAVVGKQAEAFSSVAQEGMHIIGSGSVDVESWEKDGKRVYKTVLALENIEVLGAGSGGDATSQEPRQQPQYNQTREQPQYNRAPPQGRSAAPQQQGDIPF